MRETDIELRAPDGAPIPGTLTEPDDVKHACLLLHGLTGTREENGLYTEAAAHLAARGVASLRIDFRGHGQSPVPQADFSPVTQIIDTKTAVRWLLARYGLPDIAIVGMSFGALPGVFASLDMPGIARLCLFVPVLDYRRTFLKPEAPRMAQRFTPEAIARAEQEGSFPYGDKPFRISLRLIEELRRLDPLAALRASPAAITIIHGDADPTVPYAVSAELAESDPRLIFHPMPGMGHGWKDIDDPEGVTERSQANKAKVLAVFGEMVDKI